MRTAKIENVTRGEAIAFGGPVSAPYAQPVHAVAFQPKKGQSLYIIAVSQQRASFEFAKGERVLVGSIDEASDARHCSKDDSHGPMYVSKSGRETYCRPCDHQSRKAYRALRAEGVDVKAANAERKERERAERVERVATRKAKEGVDYAIACWTSTLATDPDLVHKGGTRKQRERAHRAYTYLRILQSTAQQGIDTAAVLAGVGLADFDGPTTWGEYRERFAIRRPADDEAVAA